MTIIEEEEEEEEEDFTPVPFLMEAETGKDWQQLFDLLLFNSPKIDISSDNNQETRWREAINPPPSSTLHRLICILRFWRGRRWCCHRSSSSTIVLSSIFRIFSMRVSSVIRQGAGALQLRPQCSRLVFCCGRCPLCAGFLGMWSLCTGRVHLSVAAGWSLIYLLF